MNLGNMAITAASLPALVLWGTTTVVLWMRLRAGGLGLVAPIMFGAGVGLLQGFTALLFVRPGGSGLSAPWLGGLFVVWVATYAVARWAGRAPIHAWPWSRYGLAAAFGVLLTDVLVGVILPAGAGRTWVLGGAGFRDAIGVLPPFLAGAYYLLNDCRSPWTICHLACRRAGYCRHDVRSRSIRLDQDASMREQDDRAA